MIAFIDGENSLLEVGRAKAARLVVSFWFYGPYAPFGIVNFTPLSEDGGGNSTLMSTYSQNGLTFSSSGNDLFVWQRSSGNHPTGGDAATSLSNYFATHTVTFAATDSSPFSLYSIDLAQWGAGQGIAETTFLVDFVGALHGGGSVTDTFEVFLSGSPNLRTFSFSSGFASLDSVSFVQGTFALGTGIQFNNIVTNIDGTPEPSTFVLILGGAALALPGLRKRS